MISPVRKQHSISAQMIILLFSAFAVSAVLFFAANSLGNFLFDTWNNHTAFISRMEIADMKSLQKYIDKHQIATSEVTKIQPWINRNQPVFLAVYIDDTIIFDFTSPDLTVSELTHNQIYEHAFYSMQFADQTADIYFWSAYNQMLSFYLIIAELLLSVFVFFFIVLFVIRKKMKYIEQLSIEVSALEGGSLDHPLTIRGNDELAALAQNVDDMRCSFKKLLQQEEHMMLENQKIVTEMSHDIRTPITSILLYTDILKSKQLCPTEMTNYIEKIDQKAHRMKQLAENLFEYSLVTSDSTVELEAAADIRFLFFDFLSETAAYLEQQGFQVDLTVSNQTAKIRINTSYLTRILDNITSNILKYADQAYPIKIWLFANKRDAGFSFENAVLKNPRNPESTKIGIHSIQSMMESMGGRCEVLQQPSKFQIKILFPLL